MLPHPSPLGSKIAQSFWPFPTLAPIKGDTIALVPLSLDHLDDLWVQAFNAPQSFDYLRYGPFETRDQLAGLLADLSQRGDQPFWAALDAEQKPVGWLSICDVFQADGSFEIGSIWFAPCLQGTRGAREAIFLLMCLGMDDLGYERLVWRCQAQNAASFKAALNLGFAHEGTWRNGVVTKGWQRDVAWFSILREEWPLCRKALAIWLAAENFDDDGMQVQKLQDIRAALAG